MAELTPELWVENVIKEAAFFQFAAEAAAPDDTFAWGARLQYLCSQRPADRPAGLLLTGPDGCGKHTAAAFAAQTLLQNDYLCVFFSGDSLNEEGLAFSDLRERLNALLDRCYDEKKALCLLLEEPERCQNAGSLYALLGKTCFEYRAAEDFPPFFVILMSAEEPALPGFFREQLLMCRMSLPTFAQRTAFLEKQTRGIRKFVDPGDLAAGTEGFTYAELRDLAKNVEWMVLADENPLPETIDAFLQSQTPPQSAEQTQAAFLDRLEEILKKAAKKIGTGVGNGPIREETNYVSILEQQEQSVEKSRREIEAMPVRKLAEELFGAESALLN